MTGRQLVTAATESLGNRNRLVGHGVAAALNAARPLLLVCREALSADLDNFRLFSEPKPRSGYALRQRAGIFLSVYAMRLSSNFSTFPAAFIGSASTNSKLRGAL